jgi:acyl CoA:acetate/3-ketoacid CoA transferase
MGKQVWYATNIGLFHLTARGMELAEVMPGVDVRRDVVDACPMRIVLPGSGMVPLVDKSVLTGRGFRLNWP